MAKFGKIKETFWRWARIRHLSREAMILAVYLPTSPHRNSVGVYHLPAGYICSDLGWPIETVSEGLGELSRNGYAYHCEATDFIFIPGLIEHDPPANPNVGKKMADVIETIPHDFCYWPELIGVLEQFRNRFPNGFTNHLETVHETKAKPLPKSRYQIPIPIPIPEPQPQRGETVPTDPPAEQPRQAPGDEPAAAAQEGEQEGREPPVDLTGPNVKPEAHVIQAFNEALLDVFDIERENAKQGDFRDAGLILATGADLEFIRGVFRSRMESLRRRSRPAPKGLAYMVEAVDEAWREKLTDIRGFLRRDNGAAAAPPANGPAPVGRPRLSKPHNLVSFTADGAELIGDKALVHVHHDKPPFEGLPWVVHVGWMTLEDFNRYARELGLAEHETVEETAP
ncbi:MAG: hypothetical protein VW405_00775 [Rhodospirillaceae bacterium]